MNKRQRKKRDKKLGLDRYVINVGDMEEATEKVWEEIKKVVIKAIENEIVQGEKEEGKIPSGLFSEVLDAAAGIKHFESRFGIAPIISAKAGEVILPEHMKDEKEKGYSSVFSYKPWEIGYPKITAGVLDASGITCNPLGDGTIVFLDKAEHIPLHRTKKKEGLRASIRVIDEYAAENKIEVKQCFIKRAVGRLFK